MHSETRIALQTIDAVAKLSRAKVPELTSELVAAEVKKILPDVPMGFLKYKAGEVLALMFCPTDPRQIDALVNAGVLTPADGAEAVAYLDYLAAGMVATLGADSAIDKARRQP